MAQVVDTLHKFGTTFQTKCVVALLTDRPFTEQSFDVINPAYFESDANKWIVEKIYWYFNQYKTVPTLEVLKRESDKVEKDDVLRAAVVEQLKNVFYVQKSNPDDLKYIQNELLTFAKNQAIKSAVLKSADLLQSGQYDQIKAIIDKAMHAGAERNVGHIYSEDLELRISKVARNVVVTPWECINAITDGGLGAGELGCVIAPSGIGKSWILCAIGAAAMLAGKKVAHYTFELSETYVGLRYDTIFTGIESNKVKDHKELVKEKIANISGQLFIKYFPTRSITVNAIMAHIQRLISLGNAPDLVIIDYADLMRSASKADARHEELGFIYEEIRGMLGELKIPGWTASQSQRSSLQDDIVEADKIAGAYSKVMACDFILSASRKVADKMTNTARVHCIKNRFGPDGMTFPAEMDLAHGTIQVFDENSPQGMKIKARLNSGDGTVKALLSKKLLDFKKPQSDEPTVAPDLNELG
jgi:replicative DNA helicase